MMGDASKFTHISPKKSRHVTYGDNNKGRILGVGKIESLEEMHIHGEDHKGKGEGNDEDFHIDETKTSVDLPREWRTSRYHPLDNIISDISKGVTTRHSLKDICNNMVFVSLIEPKNLKEVIIDEHWIIAMQEELNQFERNKVWELVEKPDNHPVIGTKWVFRKKIR